MDKTQEISVETMAKNSAKYLIGIICVGYGYGVEGSSTAFDLSTSMSIFTDITKEKCMDMILMATNELKSKAEKKSKDIICDHPDHNDNETCEERCVGCSPYCKCCLGKEGVLLQILEDENKVHINT